MRKQPELWLGSNTEHLWIGMQDRAAYTALCFVTTQIKPRNWKFINMTWTIPIQAHENVFCSGWGLGVPKAACYL